MCCIRYIPYKYVLYHTNICSAIQICVVAVYIPYKHVHTVNLTKLNVFIFKLLIKLLAVQTVATHRSQAGTFAVGCLVK